MYGLCLLLGILFLGIGVLAAVIAPLLTLLSLLCAVLFLFIAHRIRNKRQQQALETAGAELQARLDDLRQGGGLQTLHFPCKAKLPGALLISGLLYFLVPSWLRQPTWGFGFIVFVLIGVAVIALYRLIVEWGDDELRLSEDGVGGCGWGLIPWEAIDSVGLEDSNYRFRGADNYLTYAAFLVADIRPHLEQVHSLRRIWWHLRGSRPQVKITFNLKRKSPPEQIQALARELWTRKTGLTHDYRPGLPAKFNQSLREDDRLVREALARRDEAWEMLQEVNRLADSDEKAAEALLLKLQTMHRSGDHNVSEQLIRNAKGRQRQLFNLAYWLIFAILLLNLAVLLIPAMTR